MEPVRRRLADLAIDTIAPEAWVIDDTGFKKDGPSSPCVARQYSGTLGKIGNCQIGVSVHAATDAASCPLDWRLYVPEAWDDACADTNEDAAGIQDRRARAGIPDTVRHRTKGSLALEMIDEVIAWGHQPPVIVADAGYGEIIAPRSGPQGTPPGHLAPRHENRAREPDRCHEITVPCPADQTRQQGRSTPGRRQPARGMDARRMAPE